MFELKAAPRQELGRKFNQQRKAGQIPAVIYGHGIKSEPISVLAKDFKKIYNEAGESSLITLDLAGKKRTVLIHDIAKDPLTDQIIHIDFYQVKMDEKIKAKVPLVFVGESMAVKAEGGILVKNFQEVEVEALPQKLPHHIEVDISALATFDNHILIKDLPVGEGVRIEAAPEEVVASVIPPRSEEELAALEEKVEAKVEEVKVVGKEEKMAEAEAVDQNAD